MKFGKLLQKAMQMSCRDWEAHWMDYKGLKKIIKDCARMNTQDKLRSSHHVQKVTPLSRADNDTIRESEDEMNFFRTLRGEIKKITTFFIKEQAKYTSKMEGMEIKFGEWKATPRAIHKTELMGNCVSSYKELLLLENFAVMNFCGISKILKKHDKWTGYATRHKFMHTILLKQPFATYRPLLRIIDRLEQIFHQLAGCSIEQHDGKDRAESTSQLISKKHKVSKNIISDRQTDPNLSLDQVHALRDDVWAFKKREESKDNHESKAIHSNDTSLCESERQRRMSPEEYTQYTDDDGEYSNSINTARSSCRKREPNRKMSVSNLLN